MDLSPLRKLPDRWREEAERYEADGVPGHAALLRRVADELTETIGEWWTEPLGIEEAADEVGCAYDAMAKRIQRGSLPNTGRQGAPLVRRCDLHGGGGPQKERSVPEVLDRVLGGR